MRRLSVRKVSGRQRAQRRLETALQQLTPELAPRREARERVNTSRFLEAVHTIGSQSWLPNCIRPRSESVECPGYLDCPSFRNKFGKSMRQLGPQSPEYHTMQRTSFHRDSCIWAIIVKKVERGADDFENRVGNVCVNTRSPLLRILTAWQWKRWQVSASL